MKNVTEMSILCHRVAYISGKAHHSVISSWTILGFPFKLNEQNLTASITMWGCTTCTRTFAVPHFWAASSAFPVSFCWQRTNRATSAEHFWCVASISLSCQGLVFPQVLTSNADLSQASPIPEATVNNSAKARVMLAIFWSHWVNISAWMVSPHMLREILPNCRQD